MRVWFGGLAALFVLSFATVHAGPVPKLIVFGDSLSDPGNLYEASGHTDPPVPPYHEGRFSNGPIWVDYLANDYGIAVESHAVAGATTGTHNIANQSPGQYAGLQQQVQAFAAGNPGGVDPDAVYFIWAGSNDFALLPPDATEEQIGLMFAETIGNILNAAGTLQALGAQKLIIGNIPDIGLTPQSREAGLSDQLTALAGALNAELAAAISALFADAVILDSFALMNEILADAGDLGITNLTEACLTRNSDIAVCSDPESHLFWDHMHPTTAVHQLFAARMAELLQPAAVSAPAGAGLFLALLPVAAVLRWRSARARP